MKALSLVLCAGFAVSAPLHAAVVANGLVTNTGALTNWAPAGVASGTPADFGGALSRANDGNTNGDFNAGSVSHSDGSLNSFWTVDLGANKPVDGLAIWNRTDCCSNRLSNFNVEVRDASNAVVYSQNLYTGTGYVNPFERLSIGSTVQGRYVTVKLLGNNLQGNGFLSLAEVQVLGNVSSFVNVAALGTANQSSTGFGGLANRALDGNTNGMYGNNSVTHTDDAQPIGNPVFWEVQMGRDFEIGEISFFNRADCCGGRLSNFRVSIFDGATEVYGSNHFTAGGSAGNIFSLLEDAGGIIGTGDRVRISLIGGVNGEGATAGGISLSLAEVQVFGRAVIPEPATAGLLTAGLLVALGRRRKD